MPLKEKRPSGGWLANDGDFYPCNKFEHDQLADELARIFYNDVRGSACLERHGWLRVSSIGTIINSTFLNRITTDQFATIKELADNSTGEYQDNMLVVLDLYI